MRPFISIQAMLTLTLGISFFAFDAHAAESFCDDVTKSKYLASGQNIQAMEKNYHTELLRSDIIAEVDGPMNSQKISCLVGLYQESYDKITADWTRRAADPRCQGNCQANLKAASSQWLVEDSRFRSEVEVLTKKLQEVIKNPKDKCDDKGKPLDAVTLEKIRQNLCCGSEKEPGSGVVRNIYPKISYQSCLGKIQPSDQDIRSVQGLADCANRLVSDALMAVWNSLKGLVTLPIELWAVRDQIWQLLTHEESRKAFTARLVQSVKGFVTARADSFTGCFNTYEQSKYICKATGEVIGLMATPGAIKSLFQVAGASAEVSGQVISQALSKTAAGREVLSDLDSFTNRVGLKRFKRTSDFPDTILSFEKPDIDAYQKLLRLVDKNKLPSNVADTSKVSVAINRPPSPLGNVAYGTDAAIKAEQGLPFLAPTARGPSTAGSSLTGADIKVRNPDQAPQFRRGSVRRYLSTHEAAGEVEVRVYRSLDNTLEYTFLEEKSGRAWVHSIDRIDPEIGPMGVVPKKIDAGPLTLSPYEKTNDTWNVIKDISIIKDYYKQRGAQVPN